LMPRCTITQLRMRIVLKIMKLLERLAIGLISKKNEEGVRRLIK